MNDLLWLLDRGSITISQELVWPSGTTGGVQQGFAMKWSPPRGLQTTHPKVREMQQAVGVGVDPNQQTAILAAATDLRAKLTVIWNS